MMKFPNLGFFGHLYSVFAKIQDRGCVFQTILPLKRGHTSKEPKPSQIDLLKKWVAKIHI